MTNKINKILEKEPQLLGQLIPFLQQYEKPDVDYIAVTQGPGLEPCLWVGVNFARAISAVWDIPIIPVNHIEGHILVNFLSRSVIPAKAGIQFPAIALVVSGGHTQLILVKAIGNYQIIGETRDDAAGECFDKCAKILGLGYPGGPIISKLAERAVIARSETTKPAQQGEVRPEGRQSLDSLPAGRQAAFRGNDMHLPRPMINSKDYDFSFSGLKTAVLYKVRDYKNGPVDQSTGLNREFVEEMAAEVQDAIIDVLLKKTFQAVKDFNAKSIILGGGVSANQELRKQFQKSAKAHTTNFTGVKFVVYFPEAKLSTDNALMIAVAGYFSARSVPLAKSEMGVNRKKTADWETLSADANLRIGE